MTRLHRPLLGSDARPLTGVLNRAFFSLLAAALLAAGCGSSIEAVRVGDTALDRNGVAALVAEASGEQVDVDALDASTAAAVVDRYVRYEALSDLLAEYDVVVDLTLIHISEPTRLRRIA